MRGYFAWTLLDTFEWVDGSHPRFGMVAVDPQTLERRIKASGKWYAAFIRQQTSANMEHPR